MFTEARISKDIINELPVIKFDGDIVVVDNKKKADEILIDLLNEKILGFDTESRPAFKRGVSYPVSLLQLSTATTAYLFQLRTARFTELMEKLFEDPSIIKVGIGLREDIKKLKNFRQFKPRGFVDLSRLAEEKGIIQSGARGLTARYLNHRLTKSAQKSNWAVSDLSEKQKIYAATDAWICLKIYPLLLADKNVYFEKKEDSEKDTQTVEGF